jgi:hypothetical protein
MIYAAPSPEVAMPAAAREAEYAEYLALANDTRCVGTAQLEPAETATCVRVADGHRALVHLA